MAELNFPTLKAEDMPTSEPQETGAGALNTPDTIKPEETSTEPVILETPKIKEEVIDTTTTEAPEPVKVETQKVETQKTEPVIVPETKVEQKDTKVETVQDVESKTIQNESADIKLQEEKRNKAIAETTALVQNGATIDEIVKFGAKNTDNRDAINATLKGAFKNVSNLEYFGKYSTLNNDDLYAEYQLGNVSPGSDRYNLLPAEKKASFDAFLKQKEAANITEKTDYTATNAATDFTDLQSQISKIFSSSVRQNYENALNSPRLNELNAKAANKQLEIDKLDIEMETLQEDMEKQLAGNNPHLVGAQVRQAYNDKIREKRLKLAEYNSFASQINSIKSQAETELKLSQYEDGLAREEYQTALSLYETRRKESLARGEKIEDRDFTLKTQIQAEERQKAFQIEMKELDQKLKSENKQGTYQTDRDGNLLYIVNGKAEKVKDAEGQVVGVNKTTDYSESIQKNTDGTYTVFRTYEDGRKPEMFNYGIDGKSSNNTNMGVYDALGNIDAKGGKWFNGKPGLLQCGEAANRYMKAVGITDKRVGDSYDSKKALINNNIPQVGGLAIWNPNAEGKYGENGHIGMVTGYNPEQGTVEITDWNKNGDGAKNTYTIPVSQVLNSDGGFAHLESEGEVAVGFDENKTPLYAKFNAGKMSQTQELKYADDEQFLNEALAYGKEKAKPGYQKMQDLIDLAESLKGLGPVDRKLPDNAVDVNKILGRAGMNELIDLKGQGATFGSLTEKEFERIQSSVLNVGTLTSAGKWNEILDDYISTLKRGLPSDFQPIKEAPVAETVNSYESYQAYKKTPTGNTQVNQDSLDLYSNN